MKTKYFIVVKGANLWNTDEYVSPKGNHLSCQAASENACANYTYEELVSIVDRFNQAAKTLNLKMIYVVDHD
jgi:hypothetical protein